MLFVNYINNQNNKADKMDKALIDKKGIDMKFLWLILIIAIWFALQIYILPKLGISTWLRGSGQLGDEKKHITDAKQDQWNGIKI